MDLSASISDYPQWVLRKNSVSSFCSAKGIEYNKLIMNPFLCFNYSKEIKFNIYYFYATIIYSVFLFAKILKSLVHLFLALNFDKFNCYFFASSYIIVCPHCLTVFTVLISQCFNYKLILTHIINK